MPSTNSKIEHETQPSDMLVEGACGLLKAILSSTTSFSSLTQFKRHYRAIIMLLPTDERREIWLMVSKKSESFRKTSSYQDARAASFQRQLKETAGLMDSRHHNG